MKVIVTKEWIEDEESKTGWRELDWIDENGEIIDPSEIEITVTDINKYSNPIEGYYIKKIEG